MCGRGLGSGEGEGEGMAATMLPRAASRVLVGPSAAHRLRAPLFWCGAAHVHIAPGPGGPGAWAWWYEALSSSAPVVCAESGLVALQAASGLPWWATVVAASAALRTLLTLPLAAQQSRVLGKVGLLSTCRARPALSD